MRRINTASLIILSLSLIAIAGCGISKDKYEALINERIALEEKVNLVTKSRDALRNEYDNLLKDKMDLATRVETFNNEKNALKGEYDKLLDEKITLKASYDKLLAENKDLTDKLNTR